MLYSYINSIVLVLSHCHGIFYITIDLALVFSIRSSAPGGGQGRALPRLFSPSPEEAEELCTCGSSARSVVKADRSAPHATLAISALFVETG
mgnify:FL=1